MENKINISVLSFPEDAFSGELGRLYKHKEYMKEAFGVITLDDARKQSLGFISGLWGAKAIYTRLARTELKRMNDSVELIYPRN